MSFDIGSYRYFTQRSDYYLISYVWSKDSDYLDMLNSLKSYGHMLHQSLEKIFREHCLSSSEPFKKFLRSPQLKSMIKPILEQEPILSRHFSKEELGKFSLLWIAVLGCYENAAELLVRCGADVNEPFGCHDPQMIDEKWTVLHVLVQMVPMVPTLENERLIRLLTDQCVNLQARDFTGRTVLHYAVLRERVRMTKMLLEKGADVNVADDEGLTPLLAVILRANELVPLLMKYGADVFAKSKNGQNALHRLANAIGDQRNAEPARLLIEKGVSLDDVEHFEDYQPIHRAVKKGKIVLVNLFLDHGADVNALTVDGQSPLHLAAQICNNTLVKTLLKRGANIALRTIKGRTALHVACEDARLCSSDDANKWENIIRLLLSAGADALAEDDDGETPLAIILSRDDGEQPGQESWPLIEALALKKALQPSIKLKDEEIVEPYPKLRSYYRKCTEEIDKMKSTRFIDTCSFFELFAKRKCQIAALMKNPEFETKFRLYDLKEFHTYADDIRRAFDRAQDHYDSLLEREDIIIEVSSFYHCLPCLTVRKIAHHSFNCC